MVSALSVACYRGPIVITKYEASAHIARLV
jgi:hypothetical protein